METPELAPHPRIVFDGLEPMSTPDNGNVITVYLTRPDGKSFEGTYEGEKSPTPKVKSAAIAALRALEAVADGRVAIHSAPRRRNERTQHRCGPSLDFETGRRYRAAT